MSGPPAAVAAVRVAVRRDLDDVAAGDLVLVACSGGADSLALLAATAFEAPRSGLRFGAVTVDHAWSVGSAERAQRVVDVARRLGAEPAVAVRAPAERTEDAARSARYAVLHATADEFDAAVILLAHSLDDQAETVLLRLARGSGARSLAGMPARRGRYRRPLLGIRRDVLHEAAAAEGLQPWHDPANEDRAFARARVRHDIIDVLESALGPGVTESLARSAELLSADADALDLWTKAVDPGGSAADVTALCRLPLAVRSRVVRAMALRSGVEPGALTSAHIESVDRLLSDWHGQGPVALPGGVSAVRRCGRLGFAPTEMTAGSEGES
ncbi:MAG: tRNA lysidine(34) synthetase TilS [Actinomycetes bacterium]